MKPIITEEMRYPQKLCEYAKKHGVTSAARKYQTNRQFVYRQLEKYDGTVRSLALRSRKPHKSPNKHTEAEMSFPIKTIQVDNGSEFVNDGEKTSREKGKKAQRGWKDSVWQESVHKRERISPASGKT